MFIDVAEFLARLKLKSSICLIFHSPQLIKGDVTSVECVLDHRNFYINFSCATLYIYIHVGLFMHMCRSEILKELSHGLRERALYHVIF